MVMTACHDSICRRFQMYITREDWLLYERMPDGVLPNGSGPSVVMEPVARNSFSAAIRAVQSVLFQ